MKNWQALLETIMSKDFTLDDTARRFLGNAIAKQVTDQIGVVDGESIFVGDKEIECEILRKARNNRLLHKKIYNLSGPNSNGYKMTQWVKNNGFELFNPNGKYFDEVIDLLYKTSGKGRQIESIAFSQLSEYFSSQSKVFELVEPTTDEDLEGYDGFFNEDGVLKSVQIKTLKNFEEFKLDPTKFIVFCQGHLKKPVTDYLVAVNKNKCLIFKTEDCTPGRSYYIIPKVNLVWDKNF